MKGHENSLHFCVYLRVFQNKKKVFKKKYSLSAQMRRKKEYFSLLKTSVETGKRSEVPETCNTTTPWYDLKL